MFAYNNGNDLGEMSPLSKALFESFRPFFDEMNEKFDNMCDQRKKAGKKSAEARFKNRTGVNECSIPLNENERVLTDVNGCSISLNEKQRKATSVDSRSMSMSMSMSMSTPNGVQKENISKDIKKKKFGERVAMTEEEHAKLCETFGADAVTEHIAKADDWLLANGRTMKDYAAFMRNWLKRNMAQARLGGNRMQNGCKTPDLSKSTEDLIRRGLLKPPQSHKTAPVCPSNLKDDNLLGPEF